MGNHLLVLFDQLVGNVMLAKVGRVMARNRFAYSNMQMQGRPILPLGIALNFDGSDNFPRS